MGKIVISTNVSLDGVAQDPDGKEGTGVGGWFDQFMTTDRAPWLAILTQEAMAAEALLLGRRSDEWFAERWLQRSSPFADRLNRMPKYVVSSTLDEPRWSNATVLTGDVVDQVTKLKQSVPGEILLYASYQLGQLLLEHDLVDELRLFVLPVVVGGGRRLFGGTSGRKPLQLVRTETVGEGLALLTYRVAP